MTTTRCNAEQRKHFVESHGCEPALGTLEQRLGIIIRRHGGFTGAVRMSDRERRDYELWLQIEGIENSTAA
jgi:hypothetical protein